MLRHLRLASIILPTALVLYGCSDEPGGTTPSEDGGGDAHAAADGNSSADAHTDGSSTDAASDGSTTTDAGTDSTTAADTSVPDANAPDAHDASAPDSNVPDSTVPDSSIPDSNVPDTNVADTNVPDSNVPDTNIPDTNIPDTNIPDTNVPDTNAPDTSPPATYTISGVVTGLSGETVVLQTNGQQVTVSQDGGFSFGTAITSGATYGVTVLTQPATHTCTVTNGSGTITADVSDVSVSCTQNLYTVGGTVSGLANGASVTLQVNGADDTTVGTNGSFTFPTPGPSGAPYQVTITAQPSMETCTLSNDSGSINGANVTNVSVTCGSALAYYFPLDGDATDQSGNGHNGDVHGATLTTDRNGAANKAYHFTDGQWIQAAGDSLPLGNQERTITAWLNPDYDANSWGVIYQGNGDCSGYMFGIGAQSSSKVTYWGGCDDSVSNYYMQPSQWSFVAVRFVQPSTVLITMNGQTTAYSGHAPNTPPSNLWIGGETTYNDNNGFRSFFHGSVDSVRVYNRALTDAELNAVYTTLP